MGCFADCHSWVTATHSFRALPKNWRAGHRQWKRWVEYYRSVYLGQGKVFVFCFGQIPICSCRSLNQYFLISSTIVNTSCHHPCHCGNCLAIVTAHRLNLVLVCLSFSASSVPLCSIALPDILSSFNC